MLSRVRLFASPWTVAYQAPLSMGFSRQEYWSRLPLPPPWDLPDAGFEPTSPALADGFFTTELPGKPRKNTYTNHYADSTKELPTCDSLSSCVSSQSIVSQPCSEGQGHTGIGVGNGSLEISCQMFRRINTWDSQTDGVIYSAFGHFTKWASSIILSNVINPFQLIHFHM